MIDGNTPPRGTMEIVAVAVIAMLATAVRLADDAPKTVARFAWLMLVGLGLATGGWLGAKAFGLEGWPVLFCAWAAGAIGSEALLPVVRRLLDTYSRPRGGGL
jgi:hypothetical protein